MQEKNFGLRTSTQIRGIRSTVVGALTLCLIIGSASARQSSTSDSTQTKPSSATTAPHPRSAAKAPTGATKSASASTKSTAAKSGATKAGSAQAKTHTVSSGRRSSRKKPVRARGQQKIDSERAQAIQEALIRAHYLTGEASGTWNQSSEEAMRRYQADNGWQSKTVPDSRALIKLGLGPSKDHLLNPESAMTTVPDPPRAEAMPTTSHTTPPTTDPMPTSNPNDSRPQ